MDPSHYRTLAVNRGFTYNVYYTPAAHGKPTLLFLHGFPSTSYEWRKQVSYFGSRGFGIVAPDLLGAGASSQPMDPKAFLLSALAQDIIDILDALALPQVVGVGHDWGCVFMTRLSILHQARFAGFAWLGTGFRTPHTHEFDLHQSMATAKEKLGYEWHAYWEFFTHPDAPQVIHAHIDSFIQLAYPRDPLSWLTWAVQRGKTAECIENDVLLGRPDWLSDEEYNKIREDLLAHGIASSLLWYVSETMDHDLEENLSFSAERYKIQVPSLFIGASKDILCIESEALAEMQKHAAHLQTASLDAGHYLHLECADEVNRILDQWLATL